MTAARRKPLQKKGSNLILTSNVLLVAGLAVLVASFFVGTRALAIGVGVVLLGVSGGLAVAHAALRNRRLR